MKSTCPRLPEWTGLFSSPENVVTKCTDLYCRDEFECQWEISWCRGRKRFTENKSTLWRDFVQRRGRLATKRWVATFGETGINCDGRTEALSARTVTFFRTGDDPVVKSFYDKRSLRSTVLARHFLEAWRRTIRRSRCLTCMFCCLHFCRLCMTCACLKH